MKYIVLGYYPGKFENMSESERNAMLMSVLPTTTSCGKTGIGQAAKLFSPSTRRWPCIGRTERLQ
jgi:hypothetical protein